MRIISAFVLAERGRLPSERGDGGQDGQSEQGGDDIDEEILGWGERAVSDNDDDDAIFTMDLFF